MCRHRIPPPETNDKNSRKNHHGKKYYYEDSPKLNALYQKIIPLGRMCTTEDVANVISFLCSEKAAFVNGQNIDVDGGLSAVSHETLARAISGV